MTTNILPSQVRAARALLDWTQSEMAAAAKVGLSTVQDFESGRRRTIKVKLDAIRTALEEAGIEFLFNLGGVGVQLLHIGAVFD